MFEVAGGILIAAIVVFALWAMLYSYIDNN